MSDEPRVRVVRGDPTPEDVAAVVAALSAAREQDERRRGPQLPAWLRAALVEGVGFGPAASPADLDRPAWR
jgi:hypothetical protein